jgi:hypothetical protein
VRGRPASSSAIQRLRDELDRDIRLLQSLLPGSDAHRRLAARIEQKTQKLLDLVEQTDEADRRVQAQMRAEHARRQLTPAQETRRAGLLLVVVGSVVAYFAWGTWWLVAAAILLLAGLVAVFMPTHLT